MVCEAELALDEEKGGKTDAAVLRIVNNEGKVISSEAAQVDDDDPKLLVLRLPVLAPGKYEVRYQVLSVDGHTVESSFRFSVR